jgi:4-amino-4-deoxy-L-arabinose transferase-like glycosyltransferase
MQRRRLHLWTALLLAGGAVLRIVFILRHPRFAGDTLLYGDLARNMLQHGIYGFTEATRIRPTLIRLPGYPLFLAICFRMFGMENYAAVLWIQAGIDLLTCCLLGNLARRIFGQRAGLVAFGLAALCPFTANYCAVGLTETCCLFCIALALLSLDAWLRQAIAGKLWNVWLLSLTFALAFSVLLRPDQSLLAVAVLPVMLVASWRTLPSPSPIHRLAPTAAVCLGLLLPLGLWTARNWHVFHVIQPLAPKYANDPGEPTNYGFNRWYRTWAIEYKSNLDVYWAFDGDPLSMKDLPPRAFDTPAQQQATAAILARYNRETASTPPVEAAFNQLAAERIQTHPIRSLVILPLARLTDMWFRPRTEFMKLPLDWWRFRCHPRGSTLAAAYASLNLLLLLAAIKGLLRWRWYRWAGHAPLAAAALGFIALRCAMLLTLDNSEPRYTIECYPIILMLAAFALHPSDLIDGRTN